MPSQRLIHKQPLPTPPTPWIGLIFIVVQLAVIGVIWNQLPPQLPLFYSLPYGFGRLISKLLIFIIPASSIVSWLISFILYKIRVSSPIYRHIHFWMVQLLLFLFTIALIHIVLIIL